MLDSYVYRNLGKYGNCIIGYNDLKRHGKSKILNDLKEHNFNCTIRIIGNDIVRTIYPDWAINDITVIIEVIKDE